MADAHAAPAAAPAGAGAGGTDLKWLGKIVLWFVIVFFVLAFAVIIVVVNPTTAQNFIYFLQGLQVFFGLVILFCFYKLQDFRKRFLDICHQIDHLFAEKNGEGDHGHAEHGHGGSAGHDDAHGDKHGEHDHKSDHTEKFLNKIPENILEEKFQRAIKNVNSTFREEWRLGLVELDKTLKDLLIKKGYDGGTIDELLQDAKDKKFLQYENAELATRLKRHLTKDMVKLPDIKDHETYKKVATLYRHAIHELMSS